MPIIEFTGVSGSGKSTLIRKLTERKHLRDLRYSRFEERFYFSNVLVKFLGRRQSVLLKKKNLDDADFFKMFSKLFYVLVSDNFSGNEIEENNPLVIIKQFGWLVDLTESIYLSAPPPSRKILENFKQRKSKELMNWNVIDEGYISRLIYLFKLNEDRFIKALCAVPDKMRPAIVFNCVISPEVNFERLNNRSKKSIDVKLGWQYDVGNLSVNIDRHERFIEMASKTWDNVKFVNLNMEDSIESNINIVLDKLEKLCWPDSVSFTQN